MLLCSVSGCARDDFHWFRIFDDILEKIWIISRVFEHAKRRHLFAMGHVNLRIFPSAYMQRLR